MVIDRSLLKELIKANTHALELAETLLVYLRDTDALDPRKLEQAGQQTREKWDQIRSQVDTLVDEGFRQGQLAELLKRYKGPVQ